MKKQKFKFKLSYSKILTYKVCPGQYYDRYVVGTKIVDKKWPATTFGDAFHKVAEHIIQWLNEKKDEKEIYILLQTDFVNSFYAFQKEYIAHKTWAVSKDYNEKKLLEIGTDFSFYLYEILKTYHNQYELISEQTVTATYDKIKNVSIELAGRVDLMLMQKDTIKCVGDFKTTKDPHQYYFVDWDSCIQKLIYEYMLWKKYKTIPEAFQYIALNHTNRTLFIKDVKNDIKHFDFDDHFANLFNIFHEIYQMHIDDNIALYKPEKEKCYWCWRKDTCPRKYLSPVTQKLKETLTHQKTLTGLKKLKR